MCRERMRSLAVAPLSLELSLALDAPSPCLADSDSSVIPTESRTSLTPTWRSIMAYRVSLSLTTAQKHHVMIHPACASPWLLWCSCSSVYTSSNSHSHSTSAHTHTPHSTQSNQTTARSNLAAPLHFSSPIPCVSPRHVRHRPTRHYASQDGRGQPGRECAGFASSRGGRSMRACVDAAPCQCGPHLGMRLVLPLRV